MKRYSGNPILEPSPHNSWESRRVFNAGAIYLDNRIHILYRAMGDDGISRLGYASTADGYYIDRRLSFPVFKPAIEAEEDGCEDPRLTLLGGKIVMAYTALREQNSQFIYQIALTSIAPTDFLNRNWKWNNRTLPFPGIRNKDAIIFPEEIDDKIIMFHRLEPDICTAYSDNILRWYDIKAIMAPRTKSWDCWKIGAAGPPIKLSEGWLFIYHGVDFERTYRLGTMLLDKKNPEIVLYRSEESILSPTEDYERFGKVPNVVFSCGNVLIDDNVLIYYGGADSVIGVATYDLCELLPKK